MEHHAARFVSSGILLGKRHTFRASSPYSPLHIPLPASASRGGSHQRDFNQGLQHHCFECGGPGPLSWSTSRGV
jgi:hypothetical protein